MTKKSRYLLLLCGFIVFLLLAPLMVLYVQGISIDINNRTLTPTGIVSAKTEPKDAEMYLNGEMVRKSNGTVRFVAPGEYKLEIKKEGYFTWSKRFNVQSRQVAIANPPFNNIYLFYQKPPVDDIDADVVDFYADDGTLAILNAKNFTLTTPESEEIKSSNRYPLPESVNKITKVDEAKQNFLLTGESTVLVFNSNRKIFYNVSGLISEPSQTQFDASGQIYALESGTLFKIDPQLKSKVPVFTKVKAFFLLYDDLYYVQESEESLALLMSSYPFTQNQTLIEDLPKFSDGKLWVTFEKQIFLLSDDTLYKVGGTMEKIQDNISGHSFDSANSTLAIFSSGQFDYLSGVDRHLNFVTRSGENLTNLLINHHTYHGFYLHNGKVTATELDLRDGQNSYILYQGDTKKFFLNGEGKILWVLDGSALKRLEIR